VEDILILVISSYLREKSEIFEKNWLEPIFQSGTNTLIFFIDNMRENKNPTNKEKSENPNTILAISSFHHDSIISPLAEALVECRCPCRLRSLTPIYPKKTMRAQYESQGRWVGKQRTRAVASLEVRTRVVASVVSSSRGWDEPIYASCSRTPGLPGVNYRVLDKPFPPYTRERLERFTQLATGCSNPT